MSILFLSSENKIHEQEQLLMQSLLKNSQTFLYACPENSSLACMANSNNIPFIEIPTTSLGQFFAVRRCIKNNRVHSIHVLDQSALKLARYIKMITKSSIKIIASVHDRIDIDAPKLYSEPHAFPIRALLAKKISVLFVSSPELFNALQKQDQRTAALSLLPYSIKLEDAFPENSTNTLIKPDPKERFIFLVDTLLESPCGVDLLLEALPYFKEHLKTDDPTAEFHICGVGSLFHELIEKAQELNVDSMFAFLGANDKNVFYKHAHALICPAISGEGDYRSILNGWKASLPVISSDLSVHTKLVLSGKSNQSALIFPRDSAEVLAQCMLQLLREQSVREELVATGKTMISISRYEELEAKYMKQLRKI